MGERSAQGSAAGGVPPGLAVLVQGSLDHVREVRRVLGRGGVESRLLAPPEGCGSS